MVDHKTTLYIATLASDYKEGWAYAYEDQLMKLLETLRKWKERKVGRELLFVSSGINQRRLEKNEWFLRKNLLSNPQSYEKDYCFTHHDWIGIRSYGNVIIGKNNQNSQNLNLSMYLTLSDEINPPYNDKIYGGSDYLFLEKINCCGKCPATTATKA